MPQRHNLSDVWNYIDKRGPGECWPWNALTDEYGYGRFICNGRGYRAHRVVCFLTHPEEISLVPSKDSKRRILALHRCDNPPCCNPEHLYPGTDARNALDKVERGRSKLWLKGTDNPAAKFDDDEVRWIRLTHERKWATLRAQALLHDVSKSCIESIVYRSTYQDVKQ